MLFILLPCDVAAEDRACTVQQMTPLTWLPGKGSLIAPILTHPAGVSQLVSHCPVNTLPRITIVPGCLGLKTLSRDRKYYWKRKSRMLSSNQPHSVYSGACVEFRAPHSPQGNFIPGGGGVLLCFPTNSNTQHFPCCDTTSSIRLLIVYICVHLLSQTKKGSHKADSQHYVSLSSVMLEPTHAC